MKRKMLEKLKEWKLQKNRKPLIIKGIRQVGKTYLLKEFGLNHYPKTHYFNFEKDPEICKIFDTDLVPQRVLRELSFYIDTPIDPKQDLVIFDEIQECPRALTSLKYFYEDCPELHLCAAGSLLGLHLNPTSFPVGKVTFETLRPMNFEEFLEANNDKALPFVQKLTSKDQIPEVMHKHLWEQLKIYFIVGGLPEAVSTYYDNRENLFEAFALVRKTQDDLLNAYYADIAKHSGKVNAMHIDRVFRAVPSQLSQSNECSSTRFKFRGVVPGISHYNRLSGAIDWLKATGLVIKVPIIHTGILPLKGQVKENFFKLLLFDVGILGSMCGLSPQTILEADYGSYKGYFAENYVAQELVSDRFSQLFSWQEKNAEVEFLIEIEGNVIPIEVKSGSVTKTKSLKVFSEKYTPSQTVIFSGRPLSVSHQKIAQHYPLYLTMRFPFGDFK